MLGLVERKPNFGGLVAVMKGHERVTTTDDLPSLASFGERSLAVSVLSTRLTKRALQAPSTGTSRTEEYCGTGEGRRLNRRPY